jgi:secreted trypsin-like serine protease
MLYGVVVGGEDCESATKVAIPGIYTDVRYYLKWILDNISA